jgi:hypothetical protein
MKAFYYMCMVAAQDVETQQKGIILIGCNVGPHRQINRRAAWHIQKVRSVLPLRTVAIHYCYDDIRFIGMMTIAMLVSSASARVRFRAHYGTIPHIQQTLTTFGIPHQCLPVTVDGEPKIKAFRAWIKIRKQQEDQQRQQQQQQCYYDTNDNHLVNSNGNKIVVVPSRVDVLLGRGKPIQEHFGNMRYYVLLDHYQRAYETAKKFEKMEVAQTVVDLVHNSHGRFLKQDGAGWVEVDAMVARDKVSHAFRTRRHQLGPGGLSTSSSSSSSSFSMSSLSFLETAKTTTNSRTPSTNPTSSTTTNTNTVPAGAMKRPVTYLR